MKFKIYTKSIAFILVIVMLFSFTSCVFDEWGEDIADSVLDDYIPTPPSSGGNNSSSTTDPGWGDTLYDDVLTDDILTDTILKEHIIHETLLEEIVLYENLLHEDVIIESVSISVYDDFDDFDYDFICETNYVYDMDYSLIRERIAQGASMVLAEVVIDLGSLVLDICCCNWIEAGIDAAQIIYTSVGTTLAAFISAEVAKAKSLAAGNTYEVAMYDALDAGSSAFYYTAVACEVVNTAISLAQLGVNTARLVKEIKEIVVSMKTGAAVATSSGVIVAKKVANGVFDVTTDGKTVKCAMAANSTDLFDVTTKKYVGTLVKHGDDIVIETPKVPSQIRLANGTLKYECENGQIWRISTKNGEYVRGPKALGEIDPAGYVWNGGKIVDHIDFSTGKSLNAYRAIANASENISVDVFGDLIDVSTGAKLTKKTIGGVATYYDSNSQAVLKEYIGNDGTVWLKRISNTDNGKVVGKLTAEGKFDINWCVELHKTKTEATMTIRKAFAKFIKENPVSVVRDKFSYIENIDEIIDYVKEFGKVPPSIQIHHWKNVANYPDLAGDLSNLEIMTYDQHRLAHNFDFRNSTSSKSKNYIDLKILFGLE